MSLVFARVTVTASDLEASRRFYATVLRAIGLEEWGDFELVAGDAPTRNLHLAFRTTSRDQVDAFWRAGVDAGYASDGEPGPRPAYGPTYYGGFLLDPDGNSAEAVHREHGRPDGTVDHLWIGASDLDATEAFWRTVPGIEPEVATPGRRLRFDGGERGGDCSLLTDGRPVTENLSVAFLGDVAWSGADPDGTRVEVRG